MAEPLKLKDHYGEARVFTHRVIFVSIMVVTLLGMLVFRYHNLQVVNHEDYATQSDRNRIHVQPIPPTRGLIYDRNGVLLAENRASYSLTLIKERVPDLEATLALLTTLIPVTEADIERFRKALQQRRKPFEAIPLRLQLTEDEIATLAVNEYQLPGVEVEAQLVRHYPFGELFAHTVGYVGRINDREMADFTEEEYLRYRGTYSIGKIGLEKQYEDILLGTVGYQNVETNARGRVLKELEREDPKPGQDLYLSLDVEVQKSALAAMDGRRGSVVALDVKTGGVIAMVSSPSFDPNLFVTGISVDDYSRLRESLDNPFLDRTIQGQYAPGSTLKPMLGLGGLTHNIIDTNSTIRDPGFFMFDGRRYRDHIAWGHGKAVDLHQAIVESCNTFYYDLANRMTIDLLYPWGSEFGLGERTGIDIPSEGRGIWPSRQWKREQRGIGWYPGDTINVGVGQGFVLVTPLQLAVMTATLANRGERHQPHLVSSQSVAGPRDTSPVHQVQARSDHWDYVLNAMKAVVHGARGTGRGISKDLGYTIGGKSGTAQVINIAQDEKYDEDAIDARQRDQALFVAYAPAEDPKIALAVLIENGGHGGAASAPVARKVLDTYFAGEAERERQLKNTQLEAELQKAVSAINLEAAP